MVKQRRYSPAEFKRGAARSRMDDSNLKHAWEVLVNCRRQADVAREAGVNRQRMSAIVKQLVAHMEEASPVPTGWKADTVTLPLEDWPRVRDMEARARAALEQSRARGGARRTQKRRT